MPQEIELKLVFPASAREQVIACLQLAAGGHAVPAKHLANTYYDTPDMALGRARVALRTRKAGDDWLQTVKCAADSVGGLSSRPEWEQPFTGSFDFSAVAEAPRALLERHRAAIVPLFTTDFTRHTFALSPTEGVRILAMVDVGTISAGGREEPICELELEIDQGQADDLWALALGLVGQLPLVPYDPNKAERGYRLFRNEPVRPARARPSCIEATQTPIQAFKALASQLLHDWQANTWGSLNADAPDFIHQMRVALRRLRTLVRVFAEVLPESFVKRWTVELSILADGVGVARDLDVLLASVLAPALADSPDGPLRALQKRCEQARNEARLAAQDMMRQRNCGEPLLRFARELASLEDEKKSPSLHSFAHTCLRDLRKRQRARLLFAYAEQSALSLHNLRIGFKRMRYALEFFAPLLGAKGLGGYLKQLSTLQDDLGYLNDLDVAQTYFLGWGADVPMLREAAGFVRGWHAPRATAMRQSVLLRAEELLNVRPPWRKLYKQGRDEPDQ